MAKNEVMKLDEQLGRLEETVANEFHQVGHRFDKVDKQLGRLEETVANEFYAIGKRFDKVDARFNEVDARFDQVDARLDGVDARLDRVDKRLEGLETAFRLQDKKITTGFHDLAVRLDRLAVRRSRRPKRS